MKIRLLLKLKNSKKYRLLDIVGVYFCRRNDKGTSSNSEYPA